MVKVWLQEYAWTEAEKLGRLDDRSSSLRLASDAKAEVDREPMFCVETAIKLYYFSHIIYFYEKAGYLHCAHTRMWPENLASPASWHILGSFDLAVWSICSSNIMCCLASCPCIRYSCMQAFVGAMCTLCVAVTAGGSAAGQPGLRKRWGHPCRHAAPPAGCLAAPPAPRWQRRARFWPEADG